MLIISYAYTIDWACIFIVAEHVRERVCMMKLENVINLEYKYQTEINCPKIHIGHIWPESQMKYKHFPLEQRHFEYFLFSCDSVFRLFFFSLSFSPSVPLRYFRLSSIIGRYETVDICLSVRFQFGLVDLT